MRNPFRHWGMFEIFIAIMVVSFAACCVAEGIDWLDKRSCRMHGGSVQSDHGEWHCVGALP